ncbi:MAG: bacillithiol biosynthesis cysteine-adding enzyme BshC [Bacteroidota bacterium]
MLHKNIPISETGLYSKLVLDYVQQKKEVSSFYEYTPEMPAFERVIANRRFDADKRDTLVKTLLKQYTELGIERKQAKAVFANIDALLQEQTYTVTTGHQLALFTGPLFFILKILSTIRLTQELQLQFPDKQFVPVFWLASEDHDFAEINHVHINGQKIEWNIDSKNQPVGILDTAEIKTAVEQLKQALGGSNKLITLFEESYVSGKNLSEATRKIVHQLFADYGLVMIEPNDAELKKQFTQVMLDDVVKGSSFEALIETNGRLGKNYKLQITGREINFFYLSDKGRNLIKKTRNGYEVNNTSIVFSEEEIVSEIQEHPENFSPNVVLRPVYQEAILPNLAYVGGPGELAYWLQLKDVFSLHHVQFPMVVLRNSLMLMRAATVHKLDKRNVTVEQLFAKEDQLIKDFITAEHPLTLDDEMGYIEKVMQSAIDKIMPFDNKIASKMIDWKVKSLETYTGLKKELMRSKKEKCDADIQLLTEIKHQLFPNNEPHERHDTLAQFTGDYYVSFIQFLTKEMLPLSHTMDVVLYD